MRLPIIKVHDDSSCQLLGVHWVNNTKTCEAVMFGLKLGCSNVYSLAGPRLKVNSEPQAKHLLWGIVKMQNDTIWKPREASKNKKYFLKSNLDCFLCSWHCKKGFARIFRKVPELLFHWPLRTSVEGSQIPLIDWLHEQIIILSFQANLKSLLFHKIKTALTLIYIILIYFYHSYFYFC